MASRFLDLLVRVGGELRASFSTTLSTANRALLDLDRTARASTGGFRALAANASTLGQSLTVGITAPLAGFAAVALKAAAEQERLQIGFKVLTGSAEQARKTLSDIRAIADRTPFEFPELARAGQGVLRFVRTADEVPKVLRTISDAVSATGGTGAELQGVVLALSQISAKGKVSAEELNQLSERNIPAIKILAKEFGVTTAELLKLVERGVVPADRAIQALLSGLDKSFGGASELQSQTLGGLFSTFRDEANKTAAEIGGVLTPTAKSFLTDVGTPLLRQSAELAKSFAALPEPIRNTSIAIAGLAAAGGPALIFFGALVNAFTAVLPILRGVGVAIKAAAASPAGIITGAAIAQVFAYAQALRALEGALIRVGSRLTGRDLSGGAAQIDTLRDRIQTLNEASRLADPGGLQLFAKAAEDTQRKLTPASQAAGQFAGTLPTIATGAKAASDATAKARAEIIALEAALRTYQQTGAATTPLSQAIADAQFEQRAASVREAVRSLTEQIDIPARNSGLALSLLGDAWNQLATEIDGANLTLEQARTALEALGAATANPLANLPTALNDAQSAAFEFIRLQEEQNRQAALLGERYRIIAEQFGATSTIAEKARKEADEATQRASGAAAKVATQAQRPLIEVSTIITNLSQGIANELFPRLDGLLGILARIGESITANIIQKLLSSSGIIDKLAGGLGGLLGKIPGLGGIFGGGGAVIKNAAGAAAAPSASVTAAANQAAQAGLASTLTAIGSIGSLVTGVIGIFQQRSQGRDIGRIEETSRGQLSQAIAQQETFNQYLPELANIRGLMQQIITYGIGIFSQDQSSVAVRFADANALNLNAEALAPLRFLEEIRDRVVDLVEITRGFSLPAVSAAGGVTVQISDSIISEPAAVDRLLDLMARRLQQRGS